MNGKIQIRDTGPIRTSARDLMALAAGGRRLEVLLALSEGECAASALAARLSCGFRTCSSPWPRSSRSDWSWAGTFAVTESISLPGPPASSTAMANW
jgi:hypothetical protein